MTDKNTITQEKRVRLGSVQPLDPYWVMINKKVDDSFAALQKSLPEGATAKHTFYSCNHEVHIRWEKPENFLQAILLTGQVALAVRSAFKGFRYSAETFEVGVDAETIAAEAAAQSR